MRVLALDVGEKRIGVAVSDSLGVIATSLTVVHRKSIATDLRVLAALAHQEAVGLVVVGMPFSLSGAEGPQARRVMQFVRALEGVLPAPVQLWDERYTTVEAERLLRERGVKPGKLRERVDAVAAAVLLQEYLDVHRPEKLP